MLTGVYSYFPGHVHAFYLEYVHYHKNEQAAAGQYNQQPAPGVYSDNQAAPPVYHDNVNHGGKPTYGTVN